tara:strand:+ start:9371 stop:9988 length:618 start_codon:yes stop_codon:yes gene_type:complete
MFFVCSNSQSKKRPLTKSQSCGGFGLVELMVSISIVVIVSAIILTQHSAFNGAVLLRGQAYEVALESREVQLSAVSVSGDAGNYRTVMGLHFDTLAANSGHYHIFRDTDLDGFYGGPTEEFGPQAYLDPRFEIRALRAIGDTISGTELSVVFVRPNFDARFFDASGNELAASAVEIDIARRGLTGTTTDVVRTVEITATGQIAVQ